MNPFDHRFAYISINPDVERPDPDLALEFLSLGGPPFRLKMSDMLVRFPTYRVKTNIYDGGYQMFHFPVADRFEFSAVSFSTREEEIPAIDQLVVDNITFHFGDVLVEGMDRFSLKRQYK